MTSAICIGECMVELRPVPDGHLQRGFAGDAFNTAVYLKRSAPEIDVAFLTATGDEGLSDAMVEFCRAEGVSDRYIFRVPGSRPALYLIETDASGDRTFHYWRNGTPAKQWLKKLIEAGGSRVLNAVDLVYLSGISLAILSEHDRRQAIEMLAAVTAKVAFDPNVRPALWESLEHARAAFEAVARIAAILLPSRQDYRLMYGVDDPEKHIRLSADLSSREIALTCDADGCRVWAQGEEVALPAELVRVVDASGAGDSFNGAYLAARLRGYSETQAATSGLVLASRVVGQPGAIIERSSEETIDAAHQFVERQLRR
jgi:2-dehydro-3-deoxygluconokinase